MKPIVRIWPDLGSTGYYCTAGCQINPPADLPASIKIALRYWLEAWQYSLTPHSPVHYLERWLDDGAALVAEANQSQSLTHYVYCVTLDNSHYERHHYLRRCLPL